MQAGLAVGGHHKAVLGAAAIAREPHLAAPAVLRQRRQLRLPKRTLLRRLHHFQQGTALDDVAQEMLGLDVVVARVQIPCVLKSDGLPARAGMHAQADLIHAQPVRQRSVEGLHEHVPDVVPRPFLEDLDHEPSVLLGADRVGLALLHDGDELYELRAEIVAQESVDLETVVTVGSMDRRQSIPFHPRGLQPPQPDHHPVDCRLAALVHPVGIMHLARTVDRHPDQEVVLGQEAGPLITDQSGVGLNRVEDPLAGSGVSLLQFQGPGEEFEAHHRRLSALEGHHDLRCVCVGRQQLFDVRGVHIVVHPERTARVELLLGKVEAVLTVQIADRPGGLGHHMERVAHPEAPCPTSWREA